MSKVEEYVQKFIDSHESDTFVKNENGVYLYSAGHSSLNLKVFMCHLLEDYIDDSQSEIDTINNSVKIYNEVIDDQKKEIDELREEVERLNEKINILVGFPCLNDTQCETQCYTCKYVATGLTNKTNN